MVRAQKPLFDDADFSGWQSFGVGTWSAEGSELVGRSDKNKPGPGYIFTREVFTDFRLALLFHISSGGRSCIYVREPRRKWGLDGVDRPGFGPNGGYGVLIDYQDHDNPTGTINNIQKSKRLVGSEEKWNEMEIVCRGSEIRISVAGQSVNRYNQLRVQPGAIGFAVPGTASQDYVVRFRNIVISSVA
ncbi:MAG: DUF1080 domain-containing protein [Bryobacteraceae bacterium]